MAGYIFVAVDIGSSGEVKSGSTGHLGSFVGDINWKIWGAVHVIDHELLVRRMRLAVLGVEVTSWHNAEYGDD